jgi:ribosomal protein S18 acetylase RimI-like enzyme
MNIRPATEADEAVLRELWEEFEAEVPEPLGAIPETWQEEWKAQLTDMASGAVYLAEDEQGVVGMARAAAPDRGRTHVTLVHVRPRARRQGVAKALLDACIHEMKAKGATLVSLDVLTTNATARAVWHRLGFEDVHIAMATPLEALEHRLAEIPRGASHASTHVQSDDRVSVERALAQFIPRLQSPELTATPNGWLRIVDALLHADRDAQSRLASDISERLGAVVVALAVEVDSVVRFLLYERGRMVDEYLSVPLFYGTLSKVDELALAANPTLVARLTGASRDEVHQVARTAASPAELPPAHELYEKIARMMGLEP